MSVTPVSRCGSSPHTRGALSYAGAAFGEIRIIPAYAGSTPAPSRNHLVQPGSSPHTRGAPFLLFAWELFSRIIPAYAGSTGRRWRRWPWGSGSSPHTRGALVGADPVVGDGRIIPAYAGSTSPPSKNHLPNQDHPRIRGEHESGPTEVLAASGSSPHTRGAHSERHRRRSRSRIIPAYAGSTRSPPSPTIS